MTTTPKGAKMTRNASSPAAISACGREASPPFAAAKSAGRQAVFLGNDEPALEELLTDEVLMRLMARDGVDADQLRDLAVSFVG
jgi:hypothetical protein